MIDFDRTMEIQDGNSRFSILRKRMRKEELKKQTNKERLQKSNKSKESSIKIH